jgi:hypothetical protein
MRGLPGFMHGSVYFKYDNFGQRSLSTFLATDPSSSKLHLAKESNAYGKQRRFFPSGLCWVSLLFLAYASKMDIFFSRGKLVTSTYLCISWGIQMHSPHALKPRRAKPSFVEVF